MITESHPCALPPTMVNVAELFEALYVFPSCQVIGLQSLMLSIALVNELMVKFSVITESHPAALVNVKVGVLVEAL